MAYEIDYDEVSKDDDTLGGRAFNTRAEANAALATLTYPHCWYVWGTDDGFFHISLYAKHHQRMINHLRERTAE